MSILLFTVGICILSEACKKTESKSCNYVPAATDLRFRIADTAGQDLLYATHDSIVITQPCRTTPLITLSATYRIPGTTDSGMVLSFGNPRTPVYGEGGECFRFFFTWSSGDVDTVDWHYRLEESGDCTLQIIDYMSFNGIQTDKKTDYAYEYYQLIKR